MSGKAAKVFFNRDQDKRGHPKRDEGQTGDKRGGDKRGHPILFGTVFEVFVFVVLRSMNRGVDHGFVRPGKLFLSGFSAA